MKTLITGITGQDGALLAKRLVEQGRKVFGTVRRSSSANLWRLEEAGIADRVSLVDFDLNDPHSADRVIATVKPDYVYNLAAQSFVGVSFEQPVSTFEQNATGVLHLLEAVRRRAPEARFYQASTSELYGLVQEVPQSESTPFYPRSPYGVAKLAGHWATVNYREAYDVFACTGILFNHESHLRGPEFVTRKITIGMARLAHGADKPLELGNLDARRDWGYAGDYVEGMQLIAEADVAEDFVLATGEMHSVRDFVFRCAEAVGFEPEASGDGPNAEVRDKKSGRLLVKINPKYYRPAEVEQLLGNPAKVQNMLGWKRKTSFSQLIDLMARRDFDRVKNGDALYDRRS